MRLISIIFLSAFLFSATSKDGMPVANANNIREVFIVGGQSNADGRNAGVPSVAAADSSVTNIMMYNYRPGAFQPWKYGTNGGAFTYNSVSYAFDVFALTAWRDSTGDSVYVVKCTRGATSMHPTASGTGSWYLDAEAITGERMAFRLKARMEAVRNINTRAGYVTKFKALLWHQGEGDEFAPQNGLYQANMTAFIAEVRKWAWDANMPVIMGTVPSNSASYDLTVKAGMEAIDAADPNVHLIDLGSRSLQDAYHWTGAESEAIGLLYYSKLTEIF